MTERYLCFHSKFNEENVFGKATLLKIPYSEVSLLRKQDSAQNLHNSIKIGQIISADRDSAREVTHLLTGLA